MCGRRLLLGLPCRHIHRNNILFLPELPRWIEMSRQCLLCYPRFASPLSRLFATLHPLNTIKDKAWPNWPILYCPKYTCFAMDHLAFVKDLLSVVSCKIGGRSENQTKPISLHGSRGDSQPLTSFTNIFYIGG